MLPSPRCVFGVVGLLLFWSDGHGIIFLTIGAMQVLLSDLGRVDREVVALKMVVV